MVQFTEREKVVIGLLLQGKSNKQIALSLSISKSTVEFHLKNIYRKLGVRSRAEAILDLSKRQLWNSTGEPQERDLRQSTGERNGISEYSSHAKQFFDPKEEKAMKNRTMLSILLSIIAILSVCGLLVYLRSENGGQNPLNQSVAPNNEQTIPTNTPRGVLIIPPEASTRHFDEVLLLLKTQQPPFHYAAVFVALDCLVPGGENCAFTEPILFPSGEAFYGPVTWMPDGENGFYARDTQILVLNHLERRIGISDVLVPEILITNYQIHVSPDGRWLVQSVQTDDPYASNLFLIKTSTGRLDKLDVGLEECFKLPYGWVTPTGFLFRCDISTGATPKKFLTEVRFYTYDVMSDELLELSSGMGIGFGPLSPNGKYVVYFEKQNGIHVKDFLDGHIYPSSLPEGQVVWSHDSSKMAIFTDNGDIMIADYDGSNQQKIFSSGERGYLSVEWFPDDKYIALIGYFGGNEEKTQMIVLSITGDVIDYDTIPTTDGYDIVGISPLPVIQK
jgi:DNA-binding CsgD family transcriptional regulator